MERPVDRAGDPAWCPECSGEMRRMFFPPKLLGRSKPGSFRFDPKKMDADDDRLAHARHVEEKYGASGLRQLFNDVGPHYYKEIQDHRKERYVN